jgi:hypothetical protein
MEKYKNYSVKELQDKLSSYEHLLYVTTHTPSTSQGTIQATHHSPDTTDPEKNHELQIRMINEEIDKLKMTIAYKKDR